MHLNKIINQRSGYHIAMYSAHASIVENIIGNMGKVAKLLVDAGGLKAPKGSFTDRKIFDNYEPITTRTLHAKVIYLDKPRILSLWTGNLRHNTWAQQANITITRQISKKHASQVLRWFNSCKDGKHLIVSVENGEVADISGTSSNIWSVFKSKCAKLPKHKEPLSLYAFSPWGSHTFVREITRLVGSKNLRRINLYTRPASARHPLWIDATAKNAEEFNRFTGKADSSSPFPHYKAVFLTEGKKSSERVVFAYIGSANLTEAAIFKQTNIEFGVFFSGIRKNSEVEKIFHDLKSRSNWEVREDPDITKTKLDESDEVEEDGENTDNFQIRRIAKKLCVKLALKKWQQTLESAYRDTKLVKVLGCTVKVISILDGLFYLDVRFGQLFFDLSIKRDKRDPVLSSKDIEDHLVKLLLSKSDGNGWGGGGKKGQSEDPPKRRYFNLKFPMRDCLTDKTLLKEKAVILKRLKNTTLSPEARTLVDMWEPIVNHLDKA